MSSLVPAAAPLLRARRTQEQRRAQTRRLLMEATIATLAEYGYSGTTTLAVEHRAGISRGARVHHFPSKAALLAGVVDHLYEQLSDHYAEAFGDSQQRRSPRKRLHDGLRVLWSIYQRPEYTAIFELLAATRSDPELREQWLQVGHRHRGLALQAAQAFFPTLSKASAESVIETIHAGFLGLRLQGSVSEPQHVERVLDTLEDLAVMYLKRERNHERNRE